MLIGKLVDIYKYQLFIAMNKDHNIPKYPIREAARLLNISVHTLRMYEREGLILPFQKSTGHRKYSDSDIERLLCIRSAINVRKISIHGIKSILSLIPCWEIAKCSEIDRINCEAYSEAEKPCWSYKHKNNICANLECSKCEVYNSFLDCSTVKSAMRSLNTNKHNINEILTAV